jgi:hypothetical protein
VWRLWWPSTTFQGSVGLVSGAPPRQDDAYGHWISHLKPTTFSFLFYFYFLFSPRFLSWPLKFSKNLFNLFFFLIWSLFFLISICFISDDFLNWNFYLVSSPLNFFICEIWTPIFWFFFNLRSFFKLNIFLNWISF